MIKRVIEVSNLIITGHTRSEIIRHTSEWNVSTRQIDTYIALATKEIEEVNKNKYEQNLSIALRALWADYRTCTKHQDKLGFLKQIAHLQGLGSINVNLKDQRELLDQSDEELDQSWVSDDIMDEDESEDDDGNDQTEEDN